MYSRSTGYTKEYLEAKYAMKQGVRRDIFKNQESLPEVKQQPPLPVPVTVNETSAGVDKGDIMILCALAFLIFSGRDGGNFDLILALALLIVEFG